MHGQKTIAVQLDDELFFHAANFEFFQRKMFDSNTQLR